MTDAPYANRLPTTDRPQIGTNMPIYQAAQDLDGVDLTEGDVGQVERGAFNRFLAKYDSELDADTGYFQATDGTNIVAGRIVHEDERAEAYHVGAEFVGPHPRDAAPEAVSAVADGAVKGFVDRALAR